MPNQHPRPKRVSYSASHPRPNMLQRGGVWYFRKTDSAGKRVAVSTRQSDYKLAEVAATAIAAKMDAGELAEFIGKKAPRAIPTFRALADAYLADVISSRQARDQENYRNGLRPAMEFFGATGVHTITSETCEQFITHLRTMTHLHDGQFSESSVKKHVTYTGIIFNRAVRRGYISANPFTDVDQKLKPKWQARDRVISRGEQAAFLSSATPEAARVFIIALGTGVRREELCGITERHCDFSNGVLRLSKDIVKGKHKPRNVPMPDSVVSALRAQMAAVETGGVTKGHGQRRSGDGRLFGVRLQRINEWFRFTIEKAGIKTFSPHDCRRTFASRHADNGVPMHVLQEWMGHSDIKMTRRFYVRGDESVSRQWMAGSDIGLPAPTVVPFATKEEQAGR